jgi:hypothetical protein
MPETARTPQETSEPSWQPPLTSQKEELSMLALQAQAQLLTKTQSRIMMFLQGPQNKNRTILLRRRGPSWLLSRLSKKRGKEVSTRRKQTR